MSANPTGDATTNHNTPSAGVMETASKATPAPGPGLDQPVEDAAKTTSSQAGSSDNAAQSPQDVEKLDAHVPWEEDPANALNWPTWRKAHLIVMLASYGFVASAGTSIISPAQYALIEEFGVSRIRALLPLSLYVFALAFGPVIGGPLSETLGRLPVYQWTSVLGALFTLGAGFTHNFGALCFLRFAAGFAWGPALANGSGSIVETFMPKTRGLMLAIYILMPFLGPGLAPVLGAFAVSRQGWRWTQWVLLFFALFTIIFVATSRETFPPAIKKRLAKKRGQHVDPAPPLLQRIKVFALIGLIRPIRMLITEPLVTLNCLYVSINFGILFSFFAVVPYTFSKVYNFSVEQSGLVFLAVAVGCFLGLITVFACDMILYRRQMANFPPHKVPPEHRLYAAMFTSVGLPIGLFWYAWTAKESISWASPVVAIVPFACGNLCIFVCFSQYTADIYKGSVVASQASANSLARYAFAGAFPLFIIQMYEKLGIDWGVSVFAFISVALMPIPWTFYKFGPKLRAKSKYDTHQY
ncbi:hypothetical protein K4F52_000243 [Lecanicillium sp. MT-2017a]|nr:hypothetical protein K4F52_000243 [Lecanicillium sp. MT-2017a]